MDRLVNKASDYNLLIVEKSSSVLEQTGEDRDYVLEGVFGEIDVKNKNNRIYTEDEYLPQIQALQDKIGSSKLLGELDQVIRDSTGLPVTIADDPLSCVVQGTGKCAENLKSLRSVLSSSY